MNQPSSVQRSGAAAVGVPTTTFPSCLRAAAWRRRGSPSRCAGRVRRARGATRGSGERRRGGRAAMNGAARRGGAWKRSHVQEKRRAAGMLPPTIKSTFRQRRFRKEIVASRPDGGISGSPNSKSP